MIDLCRAQLYIRVRTRVFQGTPARIYPTDQLERQMCEISRGQLNTLRDTTPLLESPFTLNQLPQLPRTLNQSSNRGS